MTVLLAVVVLLLAAAGGFLGDLLELAAWLILVLALIGAGIGVAAYLGLRRLFSR